MQLRTSSVTVVVDADHGASITHLGRDDRHNVLASYDWDSPLPAERSTTYGDDRLDWLSSYRGGWQVLFPNAGAACEVDGVPLPFHGEVSTARWEVLDRTDRSATLRCPARLPLILERRLELDDAAATLRVTETVTNDADRDVAFRWGHHPAFDVPPGTRLDLPEGTRFRVAAGSDPARTRLAADADGAWPRATDATGRPVDLSVVPDGPVSRVCYLDGASGWYALRPPDGVGIALAWDATTFPSTWLWQDIGGGGFPMFGRARITALEPASSWPGDGLAEAIARGDALRLEARASRTTWLTASLFDATADPVTGVDADGTVRVGGEAPAPR